MSAGVGVVRLALAERLAVCVELDARQERHLRAAFGFVGQIIALGDPCSAELARLAMQEWVRSREPDRFRDEHVRICCALTGLIGRLVAAIGRTIERATVGRARPDEEG